MFEIYEERQTDRDTDRQTDRLPDRQAVSCIEKCQCGANLDDTGYHLLTCKKGGGPMSSHDSIVSEWSDCLSHLQIYHKRKP